MKGTNPSQEREWLYLKKEQMMNVYPEKTTSAYFEHVSWF
jgi:hypothetical protein